MNKLRLVKHSYIYKSYANMLFNSFTYLRPIVFKREQNMKEKTGLKSISTIFLIDNEKVFPLAKDLKDENNF